jgi:hypothetical protein
VPSRIRSSVTVQRAEAAFGDAGPAGLVVPGGAVPGALCGGPEVALGAGFVADGCPVPVDAGGVLPEVGAAGDPPALPQPAAVAARRVAATAASGIGRWRRGDAGRSFDEERIPFGYSAAGCFEPPGR